MKHLIATAIFMGAVALSASQCFACFCLTPDVPESLSAAGAVFVGEVVDIADPHTKDPKAPFADQMYAVTFRVVRSFKGLTFHQAFHQDVVILADQGRSGCYSWHSFIKGKKYLVYAEGEVGKQLAVLFVCNRTIALEKALGDIEQLAGWSLHYFKFPRFKTQRFDFLY